MFNRKALALLFVLSVILAGFVFAETQSGDPAFGKLMDGNKRFVSGGLSQKDLGEARRKELAGGQHPSAIVVTCSDSRVAPEYIFDQGLGDIFVVRVAGNVLDPISLGSIEYAAEHLHSPLLVLMGHEKCGAVAAAMESKGKAEGNIGTILKKIMPAVKKASVKGASKEDILIRAIKENVAQSYKFIVRKSPVLKHMIHKGELKVVGAFYHLGSGEVEVLDLPAAAPARKAKLQAAVH